MPSPANSPRILCFSQSPFILLHEAALVRTLAPQGARVSLITYGKTEPAMTQASRRMAAALDIEWIDHISIDMGTLSKDVLELSIRRPRPWVWLTARSRWQRTARAALGMRDVLGGTFDHVILPYMTQPRELFLANLVDADAFHFVIDGMMSYSERDAFTVRGLNRAAMFTSLRNPFTSPRRGPVHTYPGMDIRHHLPVEFKPLERTIVDEVHDTLRRAFDREIGADPEDGRRPATCVLLQSLAQCRNIDAVEEIGIFTRVIEHEAGLGERRIIVKPHPRRDPTRPALLKLLLPDDLAARIEWLEPSDWWSALPVETLAPLLKIERVAGLYSTTLFTLGSDPRFETALYLDERYPYNIQRLVAANRGRLEHLTVQDLHTI